MKRSPAEGFGGAGRWHMTPFSALLRGRCRSRLQQLRRAAERLAMGNDSLLRHRCFAPPTSAFLISAFLGLGTIACAHRQAVDVDALARIHDSDPELSALRVYVDHRLLVVYPELETERQIELSGGVVEERASSREIRQIIGRRRAGAVIAASEDERSLWISFDPACTEIGCAFTFVVAEDDAFVLEAAPERAGRASPQVHRGRRARATRMEPRVQDPEVSAVEVLLRLRRRRRPSPLGLELRKRSIRRDRAETERARGFDH